MLWRYVLMKAHPSVFELLQMDDPKITPIRVLPPTSILSMGPGGHRQWPMGSQAMLEALAANSQHSFESTSGAEEEAEGDAE